MRFDEKLTKLCSERRLNNQREIADTLRVSKSAVNRWFSGKTRPSMDESLRLARLIGVPLDYLADDSADELPAADVLSDDQRAVLDLVEALGLTRHDALRRLAREFPDAAPVAGSAYDPAAGRRVAVPESSEDAKARKRRSG